VLRRALALAATGLTLLVAASCGEPGYHRAVRCDHVHRRCRTVCDYWCDGWGCYPVCWNQCWDECFVDPDRPPSGVAKRPEHDASTAPPAGDAGAGGGSGVQCSGCWSNDDCESGALCIFRGGPPDEPGDGGAPSDTGFCARACASSADCPQGFTCAEIGASKQCLPNNGKCE
jgi:hypothetical protein